MVLSIRLFSAMNVFLDKNGQPKVITLGKDTQVLNMPNTSNRIPNGDFEGSWTQYWITFSKEGTLRCSVCGKLLWNKEIKKSKEVCQDLIRKREINNYVENKDEKESIEDYESQGGHVKLNNVIYITPLCCHHNKENVGENIVLKAGSVLVEEVNPVIEEK